MQKRRVRYLAPNGVTVANIACGFIALVVAAQGRFETAVYLLVVAICLDTLDGNIARWLHATSEFGQEMDSFSDALSFGAAPAFLIYQAELRHLGPEGLILALVYLVCAVLRLSRFNLTSDPHLKDRSTVGVPVPVAASYVMVATLMRDEISATAAGTVVLVMAVLMVSSLPLPNLKGKTIVTAMLLIGIVNYLVVIIRPTWAAIIWWNVWNAAILTVARLHQRGGYDLRPS